MYAVTVLLGTEPVYKCSYTHAITLMLRSVRHTNYSGKKTVWKSPNRSCTRVPQASCFQMWILYMHPFFGRCHIRRLCIARNKAACTVTPRLTFLSKKDYKVHVYSLTLPTYTDLASISPFSSGVFGTAKGVFIYVG